MPGIGLDDTAKAGLTKQILDHLAKHKAERYPSTAQPTVNLIRIIHQDDGQRLAANRRDKVILILKKDKGLFQRLLPFLENRDQVCVCNHGAYYHRGPEGQCEGKPRWGVGDNNQYSYRATPCPQACQAYRQRPL